MINSMAALNSVGSTYMSLPVLPWTYCLTNQTRSHLFIHHAE